METAGSNKKEQAKLKLAKTIQVKELLVAESSADEISPITIKDSALTTKGLNKQASGMMIATAIVPKSKSSQPKDRVISQAKLAAPVRIQNTSGSNKNKNLKAFERSKFADSGSGSQQKDDFKEILDDPSDQSSIDAETDGAYKANQVAMSLHINSDNDGVQITQKSARTVSSHSSEVRITPQKVEESRKNGNQGDRTAPVMPSMALNLVEPDDVADGPFKLELNMVKEVSVSLQEESPDINTGTFGNSITDKAVAIQDQSKPKNSRKSPTKSSFSTNNCFQGLNFNKPLVKETPQPKKTSVEITQAIGKSLLEKINSQIGAPEEIVNEPYQIEYKPWQRRQINDRIVKKPEKKSQPKPKEVSSDSESLRDPDELPGDTSESRAKEQEVKQIQEKLTDAGQKIPVSQVRAINIKSYERFFKYRIYEAYKPTNLAQTRDYFRFLLEPSDNTVLEDDTPEHILAYAKEKPKTPMPSSLNQDEILCFDSNFESGNLDSAYLFQMNQVRSEYKLLMKVDSNTRGNTHWFYFRVMEHRPGRLYRFSIMNFTRSMHKFYWEGMNILKKAGEGEWEYGQCKNIEFDHSEVHKFSGDPYHCLTFEYQTKIEDGGQPLCFAYALPYTYSNLLETLDNTKKVLMESDQAVYRVIGEQCSDLSPNHENNRAVPRKMINHGSYKKRSTYDMQHDQIQKAAEVQLNQKKTRFENKIMNLQEDGGDMAPTVIINTRDSAQQYEIINSQLHFRQEVIGQSMGGLNIFMLTFTKKKVPGGLRHSKKKVIFIQARLHAAETHGSFIMDGLIKDLTQNWATYDKLLSNAIIKLVPMVNPDGVVIGNSRSSLAGVDLNRRWGNPHPIVHPELNVLKQAISALNNQSAGIQLFLDLHGHNKQMNCFFYGSNKAPQEGMLSWTKTRLFPKIFQSFEQEHFDFQMCKFSTEKAKYNTARVVVWNEMKVMNSFTLECSMFGYKTKPEGRERPRTLQLKAKDYPPIAIGLMKAISKYAEVEPLLEAEYNMTGGWLKVKKMQEITGALKKAKKKSPMKDKESDINLSLPMTKGISYKDSPRGNIKPPPMKKSNTFVMTRNVVGKQSTSPVKGEVLDSVVNEQRKRIERDVPSQQEVSGFQSSKTVNVPQTKFGQSRGRRLVHKMNSNATDDGKLPEIHASPAARQEAEMRERLANKHQTEKKKRKVKKMATERSEDEFNLEKPTVEKCILLEFFDPQELKVQIQLSQKMADLDTDTSNILAEDQSVADAQPSESDSEPSCDNFDTQELRARFSEVVKPDDEIFQLEEERRKVEIAVVEPSQSSRSDLKTDESFDEPIKKPNVLIKDKDLQVVKEVTENNNDDKLAILENQSVLNDISESSVSNNEVEEEGTILITRESMEDISSLQQKLDDAQTLTHNLQSTLHTLAEGMEKARKQKQMRVGNQLSLNPPMRHGNSIAPVLKTEERKQERNISEKPKRNQRMIDQLKHQPGLIRHIQQATMQQNQALALERANAEAMAPKSPPPENKPAGPQSGQQDNLHQYRLDRKFMQQHLVHFHNSGQNWNAMRKGAFPVRQGIQSEHKAKQSSIMIESQQSSILPTVVQNLSQSRQEEVKRHHPISKPRLHKQFEQQKEMYSQRAVQYIQTNPVSVTESTPIKTIHPSQIRNFNESYPYHPVFSSTQGDKGGSNLQLPMANGRNQNVIGKSANLQNIFDSMNQASSGRLHTMGSQNYDERVSLSMSKKQLSQRKNLQAARISNDILESRDPVNLNQLFRNLKSRDNDESKYVSMEPSSARLQHEDEQRIQATQTVKNHRRNISIPVHDHAQIHYTPTTTTSKNFALQNPVRTNNELLGAGLQPHSRIPGVPKRPVPAAVNQIRANRLVSRNEAMKEKSNGTLTMIPASVMHLSPKNAAESTWFDQLAESTLKAAKRDLKKKR